MNWKDVPNLFANGKFQLMGLRGAGDFLIWNNYSEIATYQTKTHSYPHDIHIDNATLIARKIEDMSDEELAEFENMGEPDIHFRYRDNHTLFMSHPESFLYLLSIGVYPFDQSHFKDATVIDINTITHK